MRKFKTPSLMLFEIHQYVGSACIAEESDSEYPVGEKHAFLFYLKESKDSEYNLVKAEEIIADFGFDQIEFSRMGKLNPARAVVGEMKEYYDNAIESGSTFILYEDPI